MLNKQLRKMFGFNIWQKLKHPQNPNKTNFNSDALDPRPSNAWVGRVFMPKSSARKDPVAKYKEDIIKFNLKFENYEDVKNDTWYAHKIKLDQEMSTLIDVICEEVILKDHSYRYAIEKLNRQKFLKAYQMAKGNNLKQISLQQFFNDIAQICQQSVNACRKSRDERPVYNMDKIEKLIRMHTMTYNNDILEDKESDKK